MRKNLITARKDAQLTQEEIAVKLGISARHYRTLEAGTSNGRIEIWYKLTKFLDVETIDFLLEQESNKPQKSNTP